MTKVVGVPGTWGRGGGWWQDGSPLWLYLSTLGIEPARLNGRPYEWDTELSQLSWRYSGKALSYYLLALPSQDRNVIAYSFGGYVALWAAVEGVTIQRLVTIGTPVRDDMAVIRELARRNVVGWWQVIDQDFDAMAVAGAIDGIVGPIIRDMPEADRTVRIKHIGHGGQLLDAVDPAQAVKWEQKGIAAFLRGEGYERAA